MKVKGPTLIPDEVTLGVTQGPVSLLKEYETFLIVKRLSPILLKIED
jgi:hypothetical protein